MPCHLAAAYNDASLLHSRFVVLLWFKACCGLRCQANFFFKKQNRSVKNTLMVTITTLVAFIVSIGVLSRQVFISNAATHTQNFCILHSGDYVTIENPIDNTCRKAPYIISCITCHEIIDVVVML